MDNIRRVFVRSIRSDCDPIRTVIQSNWLILFFQALDHDWILSGKKRSRSEWDYNPIRLTRQKRAYS